jgi:hypothetical protein
MTRARASSLFAIAACLALAGWFAWRGERFIAANGPTFDEAVHLASGYGCWKAGEYRLNHEDPPLLKLAMSLPLVLGDAPPFPHAAATGPAAQWQAGAALVYDSGLEPRAVINPARRVNLGFGCALVLLAGWVSYRVWGSKLAAVAACGFAASDPTLLAMSSVVKTDVGVSLFSLATCYLVWEYVANPTRGLLVALGVSAGLMLATKLSAVGIAAGLALAGVVFLARGGRLTLPGKSESESRLRPALELALRLGVIAVVTVAATYAFVYFPEWGKGLKFQLTRNPEDGVVYLNGVRSHGGWLHYFLVAVPLKLPLGLLVAASVSAVSLLASGGREPAGMAPLRPAGSRRPFAVFLVVPPLVFFALASFARLNLGVRVVLPCIPFLNVLAAGLAVAACCRVAGWLVLAVSLGACVVAAQRANPYELTFFNELVGGPVNGAKYLADSNLDWGQGLPALKEWMDAKGVGAVYLGYFGTDRPEAHGIRFQPLPGYGRIGAPGGETIAADAPRHVVAVSANCLLGLYIRGSETYAWLRDREPTAVLAGCVYVFDLTGDPAAVARIRAMPGK